MAWRASGVILWQFNTAWPEGRYAVVEYDGRPKAAYYWLRAAQAPISCFAEDDGLDLSGKSELVLRPFIFDSSLEHPGQSRSTLAVWTTDSRIHETSCDVLLDGPECVTCDEVRVELPANYEGPVLLRQEIWRETELLARVERLYTRGDARKSFDQIHQIHPKIKPGQSTKAGNSTQRLALVICGQNAEILSDDFFFLLPGEQREVRIRLD
jgi:hypothetical protein